MINFYCYGYDYFVSNKEIEKVGKPKNYNYIEIYQNIFCKSRFTETNNLNRFCFTNRSILNNSDTTIFKKYLNAYSFRIRKIMDKYANNFRILPLPVNDHFLESSDLLKKNERAIRRKKIQKKREDLQANLRSEEKKKRKKYMQQKSIHFFQMKMFKK
jgi:hypothetical protein